VIAKYVERLLAFRGPAGGGLAPWRPGRAGE
jgi:hypothetical protein